MPRNELHALCMTTPTVATLTEILTRDPKLAEEKDDSNFGRTPFHCICANSKITEEMIKVFIEDAPAAASIGDMHGQTPLKILMGNENVTSELVAVLTQASPPEAAFMYLKTN